MPDTIARPKRNRKPSLTDRKVLNLKPREKRYYVWGDNGLSLCVMPSGRKVWRFVYRFNGKQRWYTIGDYPEMTLRVAHKRHREALDLLEREDPIDPAAKAAAARLQALTAPTVTKLFDEYLESYAKRRKRSWEADEALFKREVQPHLGKRKARDVTRREIRALLDTIVARGGKGVQANRVKALLSRLYSWALEEELVEASPVVRIRRPVAEKARDRALSETELKKLWPALQIETTKDPIRLALALILASAVRPGEAAHAAWSEIDSDAGIWIVPASRSKNKQAHRVPISSTVAKILLAARTRLRGVQEPGKVSPWVFPSPRTKKAPLERHALPKACQRLAGELGIEPFTAHDLRRSAATALSSTGTPRVVLAALLNHADHSTTGIYDRASYDQPKREALTAWGRRLEEIAAKKEATA